MHVVLQAGSGEHPLVKRLSGKFSVFPSRFALNKPLQRLCMQKVRLKSGGGGEC